MDKLCKKGGITLFFVDIILKVERKHLEEVSSGQEKDG